MLRNDTYLRNETNGFFSLNLIEERKNLSSLKYQSSIITSNTKTECLFSKIKNLNKKPIDKNKNYYLITTAKGNSIALSDDDKYTIEIKESNQLTKESMYAPLSILLDKFNKRQPIYVNLYNYGNDKEINDQNKNLNKFSTYEDGVFLALLLHSDSDFYPNNPEKTQITIKYNSNEKFDSFNTWNKSKEITDKPDLFFTLTLNKYLGYDVVSQADTNKVEIRKLNGKETRININTFKNIDNIFHSMVQKILKIYFDFDNYKQDDNIGFSDDTKNKIMPKELLEAIFLITSEDFKIGFLSTLLDLHNFNTFDQNANLIKNILIIKEPLIVDLLRETCSVLGLKYQYERKKDNLYYFKVIKDKLKTKETDKILTIEKIETPSLYEWYDIEPDSENLICNGFNVMIEKN